MEITSNSDKPNNVNAVNSIFDSLGAGLWSMMGDGACYWYPSALVFDAPMKTARSFAVLAGIFGGFTMITLWFSACVGMPVGRWRCLGIKLFFVTFFEGMVFIIFKSKTVCGTWDYLGIPYTSKCALDWGGKNGVAACVFWFVAGLCLMKVPPPKGPEPLTVKEIVTTVETVKPDGTKTVETKREYVRVAA